MDTSFIEVINLLDSFGFESISSFAIGFSFGDDFFSELCSNCFSLSAMLEVGLTEISFVMSLLLLSSSVFSMLILGT